MCFRFVGGGWADECFLCFILWDIQISENEKDCRWQYYQRVFIIVDFNRTVLSQLYNNSRTFCISFYITLSTKCYPSRLFWIFLPCMEKKQPFQIHITYQAHLWKSQRICDNFRKGFFLRIFFFVSVCVYVPFYSVTLNIPCKEIFHWYDMVRMCK